MPLYYPFQLAALYILYLILWRVVKSLFAPSSFVDIPGPVSPSWVMGNLKQLFNAKGLPFHQHLVDRYGGLVKIHGFFGDEQLYISDSHALYSIVVKDQDSFEETAVFTETNKVIFGPGLVATTGDHHKKQRKAVGPMFSSSQLRQITPILYETAEKLSRVLTNEIQNQGSVNDTIANTGVLDMSEWASRIALEMVGQAILGYSFDPLDSVHNNPYTSAIKELIPTLFGLALIRQFAPFLVRLGPSWFRRKLVEWTPNKAVQKVKDMSDVMHLAAQQILEEKRNVLEGNPGNDASTKDLISLLLRANEKTGSGEQLSDAELTGQMTVLIFGAQDTTSSALSRILFMLSMNPDVQAKVRAEIQHAYDDHSNRDTDSPGRLRFDVVDALPWLNAVIKETMRLYPPVPFVRRTCTKDTQVPYTKTNSCYDCGLEPSPYLSSLWIPKGTTLFLGIQGSNRLESIWGPDAKEWKPERWMSEKKPTSDVKVPGIYGGMMSFLGGGRSCVGYKFAITEMKIVLVTLLSKMSFAPTNDEIVWNLSQIISPSVRHSKPSNIGQTIEEKKGLPLVTTLDPLLVVDSP